MPNFFVVIAASVLATFAFSGIHATTALAQSSDSTISPPIDSLFGGPIDTLTGGPPRPRRDTYIIQPYPCPASIGETVTIQYYNDVGEVTMLRIVDLLDRTINNGVLQSQQLTPNGLHTFQVAPGELGLSAGAYFIRLTTYTSAGDIFEVQDCRFLVVH